MFLALLQHQYAPSSLVAALLGYRVLYFLLPLLVAGIAYLILEKRAKSIRRQHEHAHSAADESSGHDELSPVPRSRRVG